MPLIAALILILAVACLHAFLHGHGGSRIRGRFPRRAARHLLWFALPSLIALAFLGRLDTLVALPPEFFALRRALATLVGEPGLRPDLVLRFGRGPVLPFSPRRPVASVIV